MLLRILLLARTFTHFAYAEQHHDTESCHGHNEAPPFRPPVPMLTLLMREFAGKDVVDLRPTADAAACYPRLARSVTALVHHDNSSMCRELEQHASSRTRGGNYTAHCNIDYHTKAALPDADAFVWWQQLRFWDNGQLLSLLRSRPQRPGAVAMILFDMTQWRDAGNFQAMKKNATWWYEILFDERAHCLRYTTSAPERLRHQGLCTGKSGGRACGAWVAARFALDVSSMEWSEKEQDRTSNNFGGALGVSGHAADRSNHSCEGELVSKPLFRI
jgi:hypothetical protein